MSASEQIKTALKSRGLSTLLVVIPIVAWMFGAVSIILSLVVWMAAPVESAIHQSVIAAQIAAWLIANYSFIRATEMICRYLKTLTKTKHLWLFEPHPPVVPPPLRDSSL